MSGILKTFRIEMSENQMELVHKTIDDGIPDGYWILAIQTRTHLGPFVFSNPSLEFAILSPKCGQEVQAVLKRWVKKTGLENCTKGKERKR